MLLSRRSHEMNLESSNNQWSPTRATHRGAKRSRSTFQRRADGGPHEHSPDVAERSFVHDRLGISTACRPGVEIVSLSGEFDAFSGQLVKRVLGDPARVIQPQVVLDLSRVTFMDAGAVGAIVYCRRMLTARGAGLSLVCPAGPALWLMTLLGLDRVWTIYATREDACAGDRRLRLA